MDYSRLRASLIQGFPGRAALGAMSLAYGAGVRARRLLYDWKVFRQKGPRCRTVCIGNITAGGSGKTPAVALAAKALRQRKLSVVILSRGYGRTSGGKVAVLRDGHAPAWTECGDEPWMLHQALKGLDVPILVCADRVASAAQAEEFYQPDVILLDDGFSHLALRRDADILLVNSRSPFGDRRLLPYGDLREPMSSLSRAHLVVLTHADEVPPSALQEIKEEIRGWNAQAPILEAAHRPDFLLDAASGARLDPGGLNGKRAACFCGIGDPAQFEEGLARLGVELAQRWRFPDHYAYTASDLQAIASARQGLPVVTTMKDFVRLPGDWSSILSKDLFALAIRLEILRGKSVWAKALSEGLP